MSNSVDNLEKARKLAIEAARANFQGTNWDLCPECGAPCGITDGGMMRGGREIYDAKSLKALPAQCNQFGKKCLLYGLLAT